MKGETVNRSPSTWYLKAKRVFDILVATSALVLTTPLMFLIAVALRMTIGKPVLFRQTRPGLNEKSFECVKFRTMSDVRDRNGRLLPDEQRLTRLGSFLRKTSLDELPQFWNVLRGEESIVGPRPLLEQYLPYYSATEHRRHDVRPGMTGWAQIHRRSCLPFDERLALDVWYVDHISWQLDLQIVLTTFWIVLTQHGASPDAGGPLLPLDVQRSAAVSAAANPNVLEH
jgi:sugar transferase EpsL